MSAIDDALAYASRGRPVFSCHTPTLTGCSCRLRTCDSIGKHPRTMRGLHDATTDSVVIRRWWDWWPDATIAIRTGDGLAVLDVDPRHGGDRALEQLEYEHGELWTLCSRTGGDGLHFYFRTPRPLKSRTSILGGIDLKAEGGYVIAPPSPHASGRCYEWIPDQPTEPQPMPEWLLRMVDPPAPVTSAPSSRTVTGGRASSRYVEEAVYRECAALAQTPEGERNNNLNRAAFALARFVETGEANADALIHALEIAARHAGLSEHEIGRTIQSAFQARRSAA